MADGIKLLKSDGKYVLLNGNTNGAANVELQAGTALVGKFGIDQTTPGTTNAVALTGSITLTHTTLAVSTATQAALASNASRKYAIFINDSDTTIYLMLNGNAVASQGIRLNANGGAYEMCAANGNLDTRAVNAIHAGTGTKTLLIAQGV